MPAPSDYNDSKRATTAICGGAYVDTIEQRVRFQASLLDAVAQAVIASDLDGRILCWNRYSEHLYGWAAREVIGRHIAEVTPGLTVHDEAPEILARLRRGECWHGELQGRDRAGKEFPVLVTKSPIFDDRGDFIGIVSVSMDITEHKRADDALARSERRFRSLIENTVDVITVLDETGTIRYESPSARRVTGYTPGELMGRCAFGLIHPEDVEHVREVFDKALGEPGATLRLEFRARHRSGEWRLLEGVGKNLLHDPAVRGVVYNGRDVTERTRVEQGQRFLAELSDVLAGSLDYRPTLQRVAELAVPRLADFCLIDLVDEGGAARRVAVAYRGADARAIKEKAYRFTPDLATSVIGEVVATGRPRLIRRVGPDTVRSISQDPQHLSLIGRIGPKSIIVAPLAGREQRYGVISLVSTDPGRHFNKADLDFAAEVGRRIALSVEYARLYEAALVASEAKSDFLAIISHELRTPLNAIMGYTDLLAAEIPGPLTPKQREHLLRVNGSSLRLLGLIDEILTYTRLEANYERVGMVRVDLRDLVRRATDLIRPRAIDKGLEYRVQLPSQPLAAVTDPPKVRQILLNLLTNAVKFTAEGEIVITASIEADTATLRVRDTGIGIPSHFHERIFDPFWQVEKAATRSTGGAGLGLSVSRRLARILGGEIHVESVPGAGSTFSVRFPAHSRRGGRGSS